jgi:hypothetical protein
MAVHLAAVADTTVVKPAESSTPKTATKKHSAASLTAKGKRSRSKSKGGKKRGQQAIDSERTRQIQEALIREHYMEGQPSGNWDDTTQAALRRFQSDQGWQAKTVPDARALIKLGLGPNHDHLLNPDSAMTTGPYPARAKTDSKPASADSPAVHSEDPPKSSTPQR